MAGDWIKIRSDISRTREVAVGARKLAVSRHEYVGMCVAFWTWADHQTVDGYLPAMTPNDIDSVLDASEGFAETLKAVGWLMQDDGGLLVPNFERHNGTSGKRRAVDAERKRRHRKSKGLEV